MLHLRAERLFHPERHLRREGGSAVQHVGERLPRDAEGLRRPGDVQAERRQNILADDPETGSGIRLRLA